MTVTLQDLKSKVYEHLKTIWKNKVVDPEGDNSHPGTKFTATRANNIEDGIEKAHERLNDIVDFEAENEQVVKALRFETLLLKASVTSGLTSNIFVDDLSSIDSVILTSGYHNKTQQRIEIL